VRSVISSALALVMSPVACGCGRCEVSAVPDSYRHVERLIGQEPPMQADVVGVVGGMRRLCRAAGKALRASGAGLTVMADDGLRAVIAASDDVAERLEELQFTMGEGPCIDAYELQRPVLIPVVNDAAMTRWPTYAPAVYAGGVRAVFAFPLQVGAARLGVLDLFRAEVGMLSADELALALTFAEVAVGTLVDGQADSPHGSQPGWLDDPLGPRAVLYQAQGMVMVQLRVSLAEAMSRMRAYAFAHELRLGDVAASVVAGEIRFDQEEP
jgi:hypothetical protein